MGLTKILYVEDEVFLGKIVKESLETRGYEVLMESDGDKVVELFKKSNPSICILDVMLPNKDGFSIAEEIRQLKSDTPIIFLTAKTQTADLVKGFSSGGNDYIKKPFSMEELIVRIENALRFRGEGRPQQSSDEVRLGKYSFHINRQQLSIGNEEKKLSFREAELLKLFYENRDRIIDRKDVLNLLWGSDSFFIHVTSMYMLPS